MGGRKIRKLTRHPFCGVQSSRAIHAPTALGGSVYRNVESLCIGTNCRISHILFILDKGYWRGSANVWYSKMTYSPVPPILGCLQMIILCRTLGSSWYPISSITFRTLSLSKVYLLKTGSRFAKACPILLIDLKGSTLNFGGALLVPGSIADVSRK